jgi:molybdopterin converting factor small subunit
MKIEVKLFSFLCKLIGKDENRYFFSTEIGEGSTVLDLLAALHIPQGIPKVILINGRVKDEKTPLQEGDEVSILPPVEGG